MRPISQLSLFLQIATATSIPVLLPPNCEHSLECQSHLQIFESKPPTLSPPHFPSHQLSGSQPKEVEDASDEEESFDNAPITPPRHTHPSTALSALTPLTSSYLLSLTDPPKEPSHEDLDSDLPDALPAKPTSALSHLRQLDSIRYWASLRTEKAHFVKVQGTEAVTVQSTSILSIARCHDFLTEASNSAYLRVGQPIRIARDYSDLLVVGIVVLFLGVVVCLELVQKMIELKTAVFGARCRRGDIFLDDEEQAYIVKKPFILRPPPPRYKSAPPAYRDTFPTTETEASTIFKNAA